MNEKRATIAAGADKAAPAGQTTIGNTSKTGTPNPRAKAAVPQEPEP